MGTTVDPGGRAAALVRDALGDAVLGAYLHGSAAFGRLRPTSDIDVLVVVRRETTAAERRELVERLMAISRPPDPAGSARSIELTIVVQGDVRPWRYPPRLEFQYGDWWRGEYARGNMVPWVSPNPDVALLLEMALRANHPLFGPPPAEVLDAIPRKDVQRAMLDSVPALLSYLDGDERNVVLTFARIWAWLAGAGFMSKEAAGSWVLPLLPAEHRAVVVHARAIYVGEAAEEWEELLPGVRPCVDYMIEEIERTAADPSLLEF